MLHGQIKVYQHLTGPYYLHCQGTEIFSQCYKGLKSEALKLTPSTSKAI
jgi:hypothetical protein